MLASNLLLVGHDLVPHHHHDGLAHSHSQPFDDQGTEEIGNSHDDDHVVGAHPEDPHLRDFRASDVVDTVAVLTTPFEPTKFERTGSEKTFLAPEDRTIHGPPRPSAPRSPPF